MTREDFVLEVVRSFYAKAKDDVLIGYHFRIIKDFDLHIPRIAAFWETQLFGETSRRVEGPFDVIRVHVPLHIKRGELGRWLLLFRKTLEAEAVTRPTFSPLKDDWLERLKFFEKAFTKYFQFTPQG